MFLILNPGAILLWSVLFPPFGVWPTHHIHMVVPPFFDPEAIIPESCSIPSFHLI
jgi:hypothetical protein